MAGWCSLTVSSTKGRLVHSQIDHDVKTPVSAERLQKYYGFILSDATGAHTLKIAVVDSAAGVERRASVRGGLTEVGELSATDLLLAEEGDRLGSAEPAVGGEFTSGIVKKYIELYSEAAEC